MINNLQHPFFCVVSSLNGRFMLEEIVKVSCIFKTDQFYLRPQKVKLNLRKYFKMSSNCSSYCFLPQKFDKEPHYALLKELFTQVCFHQTAVLVSRTL